MNSKLRWPYILSLLTIMPLSASGESVKVFLMIGASNMHGTAPAEDLESPWSEPQPDVLIWQDDLGSNVGWTSLRTGFGNTDNNFGSGGVLRDDAPQIERFGPEISLGRTLADAFPEHQIALLKHARGGRDLETHWNPSNLGEPDEDHMWSGLIEKTSEALPALTNAGHDVEVAGMFMWQGAKDARNLTGVETANYAANLPNFISTVRDTYNPNMHFVMAHLPLSFDINRYPGRDTIREVQASVAESDPFVSLINTSGLDFKVTDPLHLTATGQLDVGRRYAAGYLETVPEPSGVALVGMFAVSLAPFVRRCRKVKFRNRHSL